MQVHSGGKKTPPSVCAWIRTTRQRGNEHSARVTEAVAVAVAVAVASASAKAKAKAKGSPEIEGEVVYGGRESG